MSFHGLKLLQLFVAIAVATTTTGCGGGGNGVSSSSFMRISDLVQINGSFTRSGEARTVDYQTNQSGITTLSNISRTTDASATFTTGRGTITGITHTTDGDSVSYTETQATQDTHATSDPSIVSDYGGFNYTLLGVWLTDFDTGDGSIGVASYGQKTETLERNGIPDGATYRGGTSGFYVDAAGEAHLTVSDLEIGVDFEAGNFNLTSSQSRAASLSADPSALSYPLEPGLDFEMSGVNFSGVDFNGSYDSGGDSGELSGSFYGPNAEDIGGTFHIDKSGGGTYGGAFAASRVPFP